MASLRKIGRNWFYRYIDADGVQRERKGCPDRRETDGMAATVEAEVAKVRAGIIDPKALGFRRHEARPLVDHLADFRSALAAKGGTKKHPMVTANRARRVLELAGFGRIGDLSL